MRHLGDLAGFPAGGFMYVFACRTSYSTEFLYGHLSRKHVLYVFWCALFAGTPRIRLAFAARGGDLPLGFLDPGGVSLTTMATIGENVVPFPPVGDDEITPAEESLPSSIGGSQSAIGNANRRNPTLCWEAGY